MHFSKRKTDGGVLGFRVGDELGRMLSRIRRHVGARVTWKKRLREMKICGRGDNGRVRRRGVMSTEQVLERLLDEQRGGYGIQFLRDRGRIEAVLDKGICVWRSTYVKIDDDQFKVSAHVESPVSMEYEATGCLIGS